MTGKFIQERHAWFAKDKMNNGSQLFSTAH